MKRRMAIGLLGLACYGCAQASGYSVVEAEGKIFRVAHYSGAVWELQPDGWHYIKIVTRRPANWNDYTDKD